MKPLRGPMRRQYTLENRKTINVELQKNFHDEQEWRYVPNSENLTSAHLEPIIANSNILKLKSAITQINNCLENERFQDLWLEYTYNDIRYIIVPNSQARLDLINIILDIPEDRFSDADRIQEERYILMSKILVLDEIRKDW